MLCEADVECSFYTYFPSPQLCELFSDCLSVTGGCTGCMTGYPGCEVCSYDETVQDRCDGCEGGWSVYGDHCYTVLDNGGHHYHGLAACDEDCHLAGGWLASLHSTQDNNFVSHLVQTNNPKKTFIGRQF